MANNLKLFGGVIDQEVRERLVDRFPAIKPRYETHLLTNEADIIQSRRFSTVRLVELGKIDPRNVGEDGLLKHDPHLDVSNFFVTLGREGEILATTRLFWEPGIGIGDTRIPLDRIDPIYADYLRALEPGTFAEIGTLVKRDRGVSSLAVLKLYQAIWEFAGAHGINTFVAGLQPKLYEKSYKTLFGDAITPMLDGTTEFEGVIGQQRPVMIDVVNGRDNQSRTHRESLVNHMARTAAGYLIAKNHKPL